MTTHQPIRSYYVEIRSIEDPPVCDFFAQGYLSTDGSFVSLPGVLPTSNQEFRAQDVPAGVVVVTARAQTGALRTPEQRREVAAVAEQHGFPVRRGAPIIRHE